MAIEQVNLTQPLKYGQLGQQRFLQLWLPFLIFLILFVLSISVGSTEFQGKQTWAVIFDQLFSSNSQSDDIAMVKTILYSIRIPRVLVAALCGAALAAAGVLSQGIFRNPLASPTILGTTSGGTFAAALAFYYSSAMFHWYLVPVSSFVGAALATGLIFYLARNVEAWNQEHLLLTGVALSAALGAMTSLVISLGLEDYQKASSTIRWMLGSFSARGWEHLQTGILPIVIGLIIAFKLAAQMNVLSFSEEVAETLSVDIRRLRNFSILSISLLVGTAVSIAGALPFVGLVVPHLSRKIYGPESKMLLWASIINGMSLTVLADLVARTIRSPLELEVGVLTSLFGAPFFLWILLRRKVL